jgi:hypothetical protein
MNVTAVLSGPVAGRSPLLAQLQRAGMNVNEQPDTGISHGLPTDADTGWVTVVATDLVAVEQSLARSGGWSLRLHWLTPDCLACGGHGKGEGGSTCLHCLGAGKTNRRWEPPNPMDEIRKLREQVDNLSKRAAQI